MNSSLYFDALKTSMTATPFLDGEAAQLVHLVNSCGMSITLMDVGATWLSCTLPIKDTVREVLLRSPNMAEHIKQQAYMGATVGRVANRIAKGQFSIDGISYQLDINNGVNALHGGLVGFDRRRWKIDAQGAQHVVFSLDSADKDQGYPGNLAVKVTFRLTDDNAVTISYHAISDKRTPVNLTNHAYFNLTGIDAGVSGLEQILQINAAHYLPTDATAIPTGELKVVKGTSFDFTKAKTISRDFLADSDQQMAKGYDHSFVFDNSLTDGKQTVATLHSANKDLLMQVRTTKPAMQLYTGNYLGGNQGINTLIEDNEAIALETQYFPDAPNQQALFLEPGTAYLHQTSYQFEF